MLTVSFALFSVLLLVPSTAAVCQLCFGEAASLGCKGAVDSCPWGVGIKENAALVATIVAGTTASTVFSIASLLPIRFRRLFPRNIMDIIASIYGKPKVGAQFDPDKKSLTQVLSAIRSKSYTY